MDASTPSTSGPSIIGKGPAANLAARRAAGEVHPDPVQERVVLRLQAVYDRLAAAAAEHPAKSGLLARLGHGTGRDVDLMIRNGGEKRLSDFLLWECAYAELAFLDAMWPDFTPANLAGVIADFRRRERRFGALTPPLAMATA